MVSACYGIIVTWQGIKKQKQKQNMCCIVVTFLFRLLFFLIWYFEREKNVKVNFDLGH